jgi:hypothetical protein
MGSSLEVWVPPITSYLLNGQSAAQALSRRRSGFDPKTSHIGFVVDSVALEKVSCEYFRLHCHRFPPHPHVTIRRYIIDTRASLNIRNVKLGKAISVTDRECP